MGKVGQNLEPEDMAQDQEFTAAAQGPDAPSIPRWRQIEIMHERAQLRKMLDELDIDFDELEDEVFGSEAEHDVFYRHGDEADEDEDDIDLDDDDDDEFEDDDFDDLED
jgi:hypothetical protein